MYKKLLVTALIAASIPTLCAAKNVKQSLTIPKQQTGFTENTGQIKDQDGQQRKDIQYTIKTGGMNVYIGNGAMHYQFLKHDPGNFNAHANAGKSDVKTEMYRVDVELVNANKHATITSENKMPGTIYYHLPGANNTTANTYSKITYNDVYPNIDWVLFIKDGTLEYEFNVKEGGNPADIKLKYTGAQSMKQNADGSIDIATPMGRIQEHAPYTYTAAGRELASSFNLKGTELSFNVAPHKGAITIDPILTWGTYYGGTLVDNSQAVTVDASGNVYMCGFTMSADNIATLNVPFHILTGGFDGFVAKFNSTGTLLWGTYYGGLSDDYLYSVACDGQGNVYAGGRTLSDSAVATAGGHQTTMFGLSDAFLLKLNSDGQVQWCTYYGGYSNEFGNAVACDGSNNVYLCGSTSSGNNIATTGTHQAFQFGTYQAFLVKFNSAGVRQWGSYFGGTSDDYGNGMCIDGANNIYICGRATSTDYISSAGAYQTAHAGGTNDGFLAKFNPVVGTTYWSTYYGDSGDDQLFGLACKDDKVYICGQTDGTTTIASALSHQDTYGGGAADGFLVQFDSAGARQWATYYGGSNDDYAKSVSCDVWGNIYMAGYSNSTNGIASATTYQNTLGGGQDAFVVKFTGAGTRDWGTYYGGSADDIGTGVSCILDNIYACGYTGSSNAIATNAAHQTSLNSDPDGFLAKFGDCATAPAQPGGITGLNAVCEGSQQNYFITPVGGATSYTWTLPGGWTGTSTANSILTTVGNTSGNITVTADNGCGSSPAQTFNVAVTALPNAVITAAGPLAFCEGDSVVLNASTGNGINYKWQHNNTDIPNATTASYTAIIAGNYRVIETSTCGEDTSVVSVVTVHPLPTASVTQNGNNLSTGTFNTYQWYLNGQSINGATNQTHTAVQNGNYYVRVTDANGCSANSDTVTVTGVYIANVAGNTGTLEVTVSPNPNNGVFAINCHTAERTVMLEVSDAMGRIIFNETVSTQNGTTSKTVDLNNAPAGMYLLKVRTGSGELRSIKIMRH